MDFEEEMRPEKNIVPNYYYEWYIINYAKSPMTINNIYEIELEKNNIYIEYGSDVEY